MAETTPGPLVMVVQFVGFMGAYRNSGSQDPLVAGMIGAVITTWVTFVPCFLWIFLGAPYIEWLRGNRKLSAALSAITAAVVGVVLNLAVWFALHVVFAEVAERHGFAGLRLLVPELDTLNIAALVIAVASLVAMLRFKVGMLAVLRSEHGRLAGRVSSSRDALTPVSQRRLSPQPTRSRLPSRQQRMSLLILVVRRLVCFVERCLASCCDNEFGSERLIHGFNGIRHRLGGRPLAGNSSTCVDSK